ncbi:PPPDE peptidase family deubiquitinase/desumoylase Sdu1 [Schizosaccharomyces pombe]|uniref:DeSI-like protein sdu1 n=2 Tax=Schizosaccharomyces pombe TaxID=4896 RepID=SDU1_SCHPO|nr:putative PPPDE peptidase family protein [Schizosaccharomyces pombe]Q8X1T0.1 RecName: Full=DeSI-like protein sdu1; AltName: Full=Meiotically up-regulated gene 67 protein [Schizosaccharomyces pombe 972h-]AAL55664.1 hypothetical protein [Schizosaccharomyces pombe]AGC24390.1 peptidase 1 [Schizosaccharomyces pombe]CAB66315.2 PPPDE peptidase family (predicted) [Schizosaccharomyces pombe]|eukprot:NP_594707.2 putative PPPDE peptidase family protein [Schizosaccharomyces pombe]
MKVYINVYDLMPDSPVNKLAWTLGLGIYHTGLVLEGKEYAFGAHEIPGSTGVFATMPRPPLEGCRWRCSIALPNCTLPKPDVDRILIRLSQEFTGLSYSLLERNCNHFTNAAAIELTGSPIPSFLNRISRIGLAFPTITNALLQHGQKNTSDVDDSSDSSSDVDEETLIVSKSKKAHKDIPKFSAPPPSADLNNLITDSLP